MCEKTPDCGPVWASLPKEALKVQQLHLFLLLYSPELHVHRSLPHAKKPAHKCSQFCQHAETPHHQSLFKNHTEEKSAPFYTRHLPHSDFKPPFSPNEWQWVDALPKSGAAPLKATRWHWFKARKERKIRPNNTAAKLPRLPGLQGQLPLC